MKHHRNPLIYVDPYGTNPIYTPEGEFLGTDDGGLQGDYIVMRKENFKQGMSYKDALSYKTETLGEDADKLIIEHWGGLHLRADWDGQTIVSLLLSRHILGGLMIIC